MSHKKCEADPKNDKILDAALHAVAIIKSRELLEAIGGVITQNQRDDGCEEDKGKMTLVPQSG